MAVVKQITGTSETDVMSQKAVSDNLLLKGNKRGNLINNYIFNLLSTYPTTGWDTQLAQDKSTNAVTTAKELADVPFGSDKHGFEIGNSAIEATTFVALKIANLTSVANGATWGFWFDKSVIPANVYYLKLFLYPNYINVTTANMVLGYSVTDVYLTFTSKLVIDAVQGNWVHITCYSAHNTQKLYRIGYSASAINIVAL